MVQNKNISVIIPAYNISSVIVRTLESVFAQTLQPREIIVVDDGSTDDTAQQVKAFEPRVRYIHQENTGDGPARNTGIAAAGGDWLAFLDHDDEWLPHKLETQWAHLQRHPQLCWSETNYFQKYGEIQKPAGDPQLIQTALGGQEYFPNYFDAHLRHIPSPISAVMMVHRDLFSRAGLFDNCWLRCADLDMWWRGAYAFPQLGYLAEPLSIMHLDVQKGLNRQLSLQDTRGRDACELTRRHLQLARDAEMLDHFLPFIRQFLTRKLRTTIFYGLGEDSRYILKHFNDLFDPHVRLGARILTLCPPLTAWLLNAISSLKHALKLKKEVTRRYTPKQVKEAIKK